MPKQIAQTSYQSLLKEIQSKTYETRNAIERQFVAMYWDIGRMISAYVKTNGAQGHAGKTLYADLAEDLNIDQRTLYDTVKFYEAYPKLTGAKPLSWSHYRHLAHIKNKTERSRWETRIVKEKLSVKDLLVLRQDSTPPSTQAQLKVVRGQLYHYRAVKLSEGIMIDAGFSNYLWPSGFTGTLDNSRIYASYKEDGYALKLSKAVKSAIYTYAARVERIIDADTLKLSIDCGFGIRHVETVRLCGINAPEKGTVAGDRATAFVKERLARCAQIVVKTYWEDKYGRYLADIFFTPGEADLSVIAQSGQLLNQALVDEGHAVVYSA